jgi:hypothetical protein
MNMAKQIYYRRRRKEHARQKCNDLLRAMMGKDLVAQWWTGPNRAFDMQTPETVFDKDHERVYAYIMTSAHGEW